MHQVFNMAIAFCNSLWNIQGNQDQDNIDFSFR